MAEHNVKWRITYRVGAGWALQEWTDSGWAGKPVGFFRSREDAEKEIKKGSDVTEYLYDAAGNQVWPKV